MSEPLYSKEDGKLQASELWWSDHYEELLARGYRLRERYCKTTMDSWLVRNEIDDDEALRRGLMDYPDVDRAAYVGMDAKQTTEGDRLVWIKRCRLQKPIHTIAELKLEYVRELLITSLIPHEENSFNHCMPLMDVFLAGEKPLEELSPNYPCFTYACLVYPWGLLVDRHPFRIAAEVMPFVQQLLEGLVFLHGINIAHRDIHPENVLMTPSGIFPNGIDPVRNLKLRNYLADGSPSYDRIDVPAKYWYIDLGLSTHFSDDDHTVVWEAGVLTLPEAYNGIVDPPLEMKPTRTPYDAFAGDVYQLGTTFKIFFGDSIPSLRPLFSAMTQCDPSKRPTAEQCLAKFHASTDRLSRWQLLLPVRNTLYVLRQPAMMAAIGWKMRLQFTVVHYVDWFRMFRKALRQGIPIREA
ncbi:hypothetical protein EXIGLDRAFT_647330 [Exidia glandulosa HHB12029]|uniref:Protein kinase domain-containing protein n=1 Tax=Exidia glandulosa HHB12029 TaxID=1314781 RepID=A0A165HSK6_EXIGL|nr:hypothetical protein EXIGLDRAFT_647330 [Exidia glandulosa HHB12029]